jgi:quercetin dioxygenase-like cupin family protein
MMKYAARVRAALAVLTSTILAFGVSAYWVARAQQTEAQDDPRFTGLSTSLDTTGLRVSHRRFEAGARSAWHRHTYGQLLFVEAGRARTQQRGRAMREMGVGDSDYTRPNVEHWHGAVPDEPYTQVAVSFGEGIEWFDKVTDEEYAGR